MLRKCLLLVLAMSFRVFAQESARPNATLTEILRRLDALERENRELLDQVHELREQLNPVQAKQEPNRDQNQDQATLEERVAVNEARVADQAQTKVEASQKFPLSLNGMLLFNAFANSRADGMRGYGLLAGPERTGATVRQTLLGLDFHGPALPWGGHVNGSLMMDFWAGGPEPGTSWLRIRRADLSFDWTNRTFSVGQDKPLISPYQPDSLAEVGVPPLAGAGNLWLWLPQARYEERVHLGTSSGLTGQIALMQTDEMYTTAPPQYTGNLAQARPAVEGRLAFWHKFDDVRRVDVGSGFHTSQTHVGGKSVDSRIASLDWRFMPSSHLQFTGTLYKGTNVSGLGALGNGFGASQRGNLQPIESGGGWAQISMPLTKRLTWNLFSGFENDHGRYVPYDNIVRDFTYASNLAYRLSPNVIVSFEGLQMRAHTQSGLGSIHNHYDLALAYLF
jgi:hypothetical protein